MNIIPSLKKEDADSGTSSEQMHEVVHYHSNEMNITDGGEFLDDGIRMTDQPFEEPTIETEE